MRCSVRPFNTKLFPVRQMPLRAPGLFVTKMSPQHRNGCNMPVSRRLGKIRCTKPLTVSLGKIHFILSANTSMGSFGMAKSDCQSWLHQYLGVEGNTHTQRRVGTMFLISMAARIYRAGM